jgi:hypothetical protein
VLRHATVDRIQRGRDHVDAEHHAGAAAVGVVVDLTVAERRRVAVREQSQVELSAEDRRDRTLLRQPREGVRHEREDVELH